MIPNLSIWHRHHVDRRVKPSKCTVLRTTPKPRIAHVLRARDQCAVPVHIVPQAAGRLGGIEVAVYLTADVDREPVYARGGYVDELLQAERARGGSADGDGGHHVGGCRAGGSYAAEEVGVVAVQGVRNGLPGEGCEVEE
jgi:hypothetical protein